MPVLERLAQGDELAMLEIARQVAEYFGRSGADSISYAWAGLAARTVRDIAKRWSDPARSVSAADLILQESRRAFWDQVLRLAFTEGHACAYALLQATILRRVAAQPGARKLEREWEDIAQEVSVGLMQAWSAGQIQHSAWSLLHTIVQRRFIDFARKARPGDEPGREPFEESARTQIPDPRGLEDGDVWAHVLERVLRDGDASEHERFVLRGRAEGWSREELLEEVLLKGKGPARTDGEPWTLGRVAALERKGMRRLYLGLVRGLPDHPPELRRVFEAAFPAQGRRALARVAADLRLAEERVLEFWQTGLRLLGIPG